MLSAFGIGDNTVSAVWAETAYHSWSRIRSFWFISGGSDVVGAFLWREAWQGALLGP
jgi:hypothetical protein